MGMEALARAAEAAGYAMASIEDVDYVTVAAPVGDAVARGARTPKTEVTTGQLVPVTAAKVAGEKTVVASLVEQSVAAGNAIRQTVYGYIGSRGAPA